MPRWFAAVIALALALTGASASASASEPARRGPIGRCVVTEAVSLAFDRAQADAATLLPAEYFASTAAAETAAPYLRPSTTGLPLRTLPLRLCLTGDEPGCHISSSVPVAPRANLSHAAAVFALGSSTSWPPVPPPGLAPPQASPPVEPAGPFDAHASAPWRPPRTASRA